MIHRFVFALMVVAIAEGWLITLNRKQHDSRYYKSRYFVQNTVLVSNCGCPLYFVSCYSGCFFDCTDRSCGVRQNRVIRKTSNLTLLLPCTLEGWDLNKDGFVQLNEFMFTAHTKMNDKLGQEAFNKIDINKDGVMSAEELEIAPIKKEKCLLRLIVFVLMMASITEEWLIRLRRNRHNIHRTDITVNCGCSIYGVTCYSECQFDCSIRTCGRKRKRIINKTSKLTLLLPCTLEGWDLNKDGVVQLDEFMFTAHSKLNDKIGLEAFNRIDVNNDGVMSKTELANAPLEKEKC